MKNVISIIAVLAIVLMPVVSAAQKSPTDKLFDKYGAKDGFTTVHITKELFSLFAEVTEESDSEDANELQNVLNGLEYVRILFYECDDGDEYAILNDFREQLNNMEMNNFTELMTIKDNNEEVKFMIRKEGKIIKELLLLFNDKNQAGFVSITGDINLKSIAKLSNSMNIKGLEKLQEIHEYKKDRDDDKDEDND